MSTPRHAPLLIVEDDLALQKQLKWSLDRFESVTADDVASAVLQFRRHGPAVVTMDLGLPPDRDSVSEGFKCLEKLLELDPGVKVIVLTGQNDQENALRAIRMGACDFLSKPVDPDVLMASLDLMNVLPETTNTRISGRLLDIINNNGTGVQNNAGGTTRLSNNTITNNTTGITGTTLSYGNNRIAGNTSAGTAPTAIGAASNNFGQQ